jgi:sulfur carrier protein ThiS
MGSSDTGGAGGGCQVAVISDFYVPGDFVATVLNGVGIAVEPSNVFVSCNEQATKKSGALFGVVSQRYHLPTSQMCHTGDHPVSDDAQARRAGLMVRPYMRSAPTPAEITLADSVDGVPGRRSPASALANSADDAPGRLIASALAGAARRARLDRELDGRADDLWSIATAIAGPLLFGYVYWLLSQARQSGIRRLYFLARDGQILLRIAQLIDAQLGTGLDLRYLHASRRAWFLPSAALGSAQNRAAAVLADPTVSISDLLETLGVEDSEVAASLEAAGFPRHSWREQVGADGLRKVICEAPFNRLIAERAVRERELCVGYLTQQGLFEGVSSAIVDIGWKGRLQSALARLCLAQGAPLPTGFYLALRQRPSAELIGATHVYMEGVDALALNPTLVELFSAADHGSTLGYTRSSENGIVHPVLAAGHQGALDWGIPAFQEGVLSFSLNMLDAMEMFDGTPLVAAMLDETSLVAAMRKSSVRVMRRLVRNPSAAEAALLGSFPHAAGQFHGDQSELAPRLPLPLMLRGLLRPAALDNRTHWQQASIARSSPSPKLALRLWGARVEGVPRMKRWFRSAGQSREIT